MLTVTMTGLKETETWLASVAEGLEKVPENFSKRADVKNDLLDIAVRSLQWFNIEETGVAIENLRAVSTADNKGIVVYEEWNQETRAKLSPYGMDTYLIFFLEEYAPRSFLKPQGVAEGRDFFALWPDLMRGTVQRAVEEEVKKALK
jgi:hypothetical protein